MTYTNERQTILVLMSTYNGDKYIEQQIESIMNQKVDAEIFLRIRDDGSSDKTCEVIERLIHKYTGHIELIKGNNKGYNASFFELINSASGFSFYSISDQDDVWMDDKLQSALKRLNREKSNVPLLYASTSYLVEDDLVPYGKTRKQEREFSIFNTIIQNICPGHTQVMNNALLKLVQNDIYAERIYVYDAWICNTAMLYGKILYDNNSHTFYRQHCSNQLGYGKGKLGQIVTSMKHAAKGDGDKYRRQIEYFFEVNKKELQRQGYDKEIQKFIESKSITSKLSYAVMGKLYRQSKMETIIFRIAMILGEF